MNSEGMFIIRFQNNDYLQTLDLSYNRLGDDGGQILGPAIGESYCSHCACNLICSTG